MENRTASWQWLLTLTFLNTLILCASGMPAVLTDPIPQSYLTNSFYFLVYISQNFLFACILGIILLPIFLLVKSDRLKIIFSFIPVTFTLLMCFMNAKVFAFWRVHVNGSLLHMYFSKGGGSQVFEVHDTMYVWIAMAVIVFLALSFLVIVISKKYQHYFNLKCWFGAFIFIYIIAQSAFIFLSMQNNMRLLQYTMKIPYFYDLSWVHGLQKMGVVIFPKKCLSTELHAILSDHQKLHYPLHPL